MAVDATWAGSTANAYIDLTDCNSYLTQSVYDYSAWTSATTAQRTACLIQATKDIDGAFPWMGDRYYYYQRLAFPRTLYTGEDEWPVRLTNVPPIESNQAQVICKEQVRIACCEQALYLLDTIKGRDEHADNIRRGIIAKSETISKLSESTTYKPQQGSRLCYQAVQALQDYRGSGPSLSRG